MSFILGIDYGSKYIGLAFGDEEQGVAYPLEDIRAHGKITNQINDIVKAADDYSYKKVVIGLPFNMDGSEGPQAEKTRQFGNAFQKQTGLKVMYFDERLSSVRAQELMDDVGVVSKKSKEKKRRVDSLAAKCILDAYFESIKNDK